MNIFRTKLILIAKICFNIICLAAIISPVLGTDLYVDDDFTPSTPGWGVTHFSTISDAFIVAVEDDAVKIYSGIYTEEINLSIPVSLMAVTGENPVMDGTGLGSSTGITVSASGIIINGITIKNYDNGIVVTSSGNVQVSQCKIFDNILFGMVNQNVSLVSSALNCWWGASSGPYDPSDDRGAGGLYNPNGLGNQASDHIIYYPWSVNTTFTQKSVEFGLYNTGCATFEVRLKPLTGVVSNTTMMQFTVRWQAGTVNLVNVSSPLFGLILDNLVTGVGGYNYAVFTSANFTAVNWTAGTEVPVLTFSHDESGTGFCDFEIVTDAWTVANNADPYLELMGTDYSGFTYHRAEYVYLDDCDNLTLQARILLEGPYDSLTNLMKTDINPDIPLNQPYFYPPWSYMGTENLVTIPVNMIDWVLVELRSTPSGPAIDRTAGILMKDGIIMDASMDGTISFNGITPFSPYYVVVHHRNHLPVMSKYPVIIPNPILYNFSDTLNFPPYGTGRKALSKLKTGVYGLITGDVNNDGKIKYSGGYNDRGLIINKIFYVTGSPILTQTISGYYWEDLNMNDIVKYSGPQNDQREIILNLVELTGSTSLTSVFTCVVPGYSTKAPTGNNYAMSPLTDLVDLGIFESSGTDELVIKVKPNYNITSLSLTNIQFTVRWPETSSVSLLWPTSNPINAIYNIQPQGPITVADGYKHQIFAAVNGTNITWSAGQEYPVLYFKYYYTTPVCNEFELSSDLWTQDNNGVYYLEILGEDRTGIFYEPIVSITSQGGEVTGSKSICLGSSTGLLTLINYSGTIQKWQKSFAEGAWADIPGTAGIINYSEVPAQTGVWKYRAEVSKFGCDPAYSDSAVINVFDEVIWTGDIDDHWDEPGNWYGCGIPDITLDVIIPDVSPKLFPDVTVDGYCKTLKIMTGASVTLRPSGSLTIGHMVYGK
jgi:hypothetical protein